MLKVPAKHQSIGEKATTGRSQKNGIMAYCRDKCCNGQAREVRLCVCPGCPLFFFRMGRARRRDGESVLNVPANRKYTDGIGRYLNLYENALSGKSRRVAIRAACLLCSTWNSAGVRHCWNKVCPLWPYRLTGAKKPIKVVARWHSKADSSRQSPPPERVSEAIVCASHVGLGARSTTGKLIVETGENEVDPRSTVSGVMANEDASHAGASREGI